MHNRYGYAAFAGASGASAAVCIYFDVVGQIVVDDVCEVADVEPAGGHVGGNQYLQMPNAEFVHHIVALCLTEVAM